MKRSANTKEEMKKGYERESDKYKKTERET